MIRVEVGNIVTGNYPVFCHQVNCKGVMGAGVAKQIKERYPEIYKAYKEMCDQGNARLGDISIVQTVDAERFCFNMFAQYSYGRDGCYTDYTSFKKCLDTIAEFTKEPYVRDKAMNGIAFPMYIGCGLAGGDWNIIYPMLEEFANNIDFDVVLVKLYA